MQDGQVAHQNAAAGAIAAIEAHWGQQHILMEDTPAASKHTAGVSRLFCTCLVQLLFGLGAGCCSRSHAYKQRLFPSRTCDECEHHGGQWHLRCATWHPIVAYAHQVPIFL